MVSLLVVWSMLHCIFQASSVGCVDPETIAGFVREVQGLYLTAQSAIEDARASPEKLTNLWTRLEAAVMHLKRTQWYLATTKPCAEEILTILVQNLLCMENRIGALIERYSCLVPLLREELCYRAPLTATGSVGRPSFIITKEQLEIMRSYGLSWIDIAKALGVSVSTIWRRRVSLGIERRKHYGRRVVELPELLEVVAEIKERAADAGIVMIEGELAAQSLYAKRSTIPEALILRDPIGANLRWRNLTPRVTYCVPGPNSLWHLDGNHKMIRSETVAGQFIRATGEFCWPSRVRTDKGGENVEVARLMIERRGEGRGIIIQGSSVHNQRIERLWRDMRRMVTEYFRRLFYFLENHDLLDPNNDVDLFALHFVFLPRINQNLEKFKVSWNNHKLSTEKQKTPNQLYILGMLRLLGSEYYSVRDFFEDNTINPEEYGSV